MADTYRNFAELSATERQGIDFRICRSLGKSLAAIIAPHGGKIEPGTSEIASAIAGSTHSLYCFEGLKPRGNGVLHITSANFDEPTCIHLLSTSDIVVSVHGLAGADDAIEVGGLDARLRDAISAALAGAGFAAKAVTAGKRAGIDPNNICNRGRKEAGVQLEIKRGLRDGLRAQQHMSRFTSAVRKAIEREIGQ
jgi:phage replication-related protein YjqB (UPF0714/DUF867 family)